MTLEIIMSQWPSYRFQQYGKAFKVHTALKHKLKPTNIFILIQVSFGETDQRSDLCLLALYKMIN